MLNVDKVGGSHGNFTPDDQMPGLDPAATFTDNTAAEVLAYLDLPAGTTTMGVNSDDGFRVTIGGGAPQDKFNGVNVGQFDGGRGAADTLFTFSVTQAGIYAARMIWENGGGDANVEWFTVSSDGTTKVLVNDTANGGIKAYRAVTMPSPKAYVRTALPLVVVMATAEEAEAHEAMLKIIAKASGGKCLWQPVPVPASAPAQRPVAAVLLLRERAAPLRGSAHVGLIRERKDGPMPVLCP